MGLNQKERLMKFYRYILFPKIKHIRGTQFLNEKLKNLALRDEPKVKEDEIADIQKKDWNNLIILDGCRHDLFEEVKGSSDSIISPGSSSSHFTAEMFSEGDWSDTVMVTANAHIDDAMFKDLTGRNSGEVFHTVFRVYNEGWSKELSTVPPEEVVKQAKTAEKLFPGKRKIIWFMQPHHPFLGTKLMPERDKALKVNFSEKEGTVWDKAGRGEFSDQQVWKAYRHNLEKVLDHVDELLPDLGGKTVVTSDHGNFVGEGGLYAHPPRRRERVLREVPWHEYSMDS